MTITPEDLVRREVHCCVSSLVSTLAQGYGNVPFTAENTLGGRTDQSALSAVRDLTEQAMELASPLDDWEEAATEAGWEDVTTDDFPPNTQFRDKNDDMRWACSGWQSLCEAFDIEPYQREVFEHWIVSDWLADKLEAKGEKVDKDFAGLTIWARTTTGQDIASDWVIEAICAELNQ